MPDDEDPPVRRFALKPKEVVRTDSSARPGDGTAISVALMHRLNEIAAERSSLGKRGDSPPPPADTAGEPARSPVLGFKEITPTETPARPGDGTAISVGLIHRQNRIAADKLGTEIVAMPPRRRSRRTRDFLFLVTLAAAVAALFLLQLPRTRGTLIMGLVIVGYAAAMLAWIMFGVMDDY
jgi:hypothetical protein